MLLSPVFISIMATAAATTRSNTDKAVIDHLLTILNRRPANSQVYLALAAAFGWDTTDPDTYVLYIFFDSINTYYKNCQQFPTTVIKYANGTDLSFSDHSMLLNLHLLVAHMHYKYNGIAATNQQWRAFTLNDWGAFLTGPMPSIQGTQMPSQDTPLLNNFQKGIKCDSYGERPVGAIPPW